VRPCGNGPPRRAKSPAVVLRDHGSVEASLDLVHSRFLILVVNALFVFALRSAAATPRVALSFEAPESCPSESDLVAAVEERGASSEQSSGATERQLTVVVRDRYPMDPTQVEFGTSCGADGLREASVLWYLRDRAPVFGSWWRSSTRPAAAGAPQGAIPVSFAVFFARPINTCPAGGSFSPSPRRGFAHFSHK